MRFVFVILIVALAIISLLSQRKHPVASESSKNRTSTSPIFNPQSQMHEPRDRRIRATPSMVPTKVYPKIELASDSNSERAAQFVIEDGVAVVHGDMVVGQITGAPPSGKVMLPKVYPWKRNEIAIAIDPNIPRPERIQQAIQMFEGTAVKFIPFTDQEDALVFIPGTGQCKSYIGKVKGKQPIWIAPNCEADSVAHEIMHALGFVHEQSRTDRDSYVEVLNDNIKPEFRFNFEKLPDDFMSVTELSDFDYGSIMMYPATAFSKDGQPTIQSRRADQTIQPSKTLSQKDVDRINREFGNK